MPERITQPEDLHIEIVSDVVCPWCYIGTRRLAGALAILRSQGRIGEVRTTWRPYFLNPDTPPEGEPYRPFLERKFGGRQQVDELLDRVRAAGRGVGLELAFEKIAVRANTLQAHRLIHWAQQRGRAEAVVERLFAANFIEGRNVGDRAVLVDVGSAAGLPPAELDRYLASAEDAALVVGQAEQARTEGVAAVPTYRCNGRSITGAEQPATLAEAIGATLDW